MEQVSFKLDIFEGPLELLMQLLSKNKVSIYDIPIAEICDQYMDEIKKMQDMDLEVSSEFLTMAAHLLYIKSRMLLPKNKEEVEEEDPRAQLVERLLEYQKYKSAAEYLGEREFSSRFMFFKQPEDIEPVKEPPKETYSSDDLVRAFQDILERAQRRVPPAKQVFEGIIHREPVSIQAQQDFVLGLLAETGEVAFEKIFEDMYNKSQMIATFLGILELIKMKRIEANFNKKINDFMIVELKSGDNNND